MAAGRESYQARVKAWLHACFGPQIAIDKVERNHRFLEEALEVVQSTGCTQSEAHQLVDYVFARQKGVPGQEVGGAMNTLAALCLAHGLDMYEEGERELARVSEPETMAKIRAKQAAKPKHSPLPQDVGSIPQKSARSPRWFHKGRGKVYAEIGRAELQLSPFPDGSVRLLAEGDVFVVYQADDGRLWVRHVDEFGDGRFEPILDLHSPAGSINDVVD